MQIPLPMLILDIFRYKVHLKMRKGRSTQRSLKQIYIEKKRFQFRGTKAKQSGPLGLSPSFLPLSYYLIKLPCQMAGRQEFDTVKLKWTNRENSQPGAIILIRHAFNRFLHAFFFYHEDILSVYLESQNQNFRACNKSQLSLHLAYIFL